MNSRAILRITVHAGALLPLAILVYDYYTDQLTYNPIQAAIQRTGDFAIVLLLLTLTVTPAITLLHLPVLTPLRRTLGLYTFFYAAIHLAIYVGLDYGFDWTHIIQSVQEKPFIVAGLAAFLIILALAGTSYQYWMKKMGKGWKKLHRLIYPAGFIVILHYAWAKKGNLFTMQGDEFLPLSALIVYLGLMAARLPIFRRFVTAHRHANLTVSPQPRKG